MDNEKANLLEELKELQEELKTIAGSFIDVVGDFLDGSLMNEIEAAQQDIEALQQQDTTPLSGEEMYKERARTWLMENLQRDWYPEGAVNSVMDAVEIRLLSRETLEAIAWEVAEERGFIREQRLDAEQWLLAFFAQRDMPSIQTTEIFDQVKENCVTNWLKDGVILELIARNHTDIEEIRNPDAASESDFPEFTKFKYKSSQVDVEIDIAKEFIARIPVEWRRSLVEIEIRAAYTPSAEIVVKVDNQEGFNMRVSAGYTTRTVKEEETDEEYREHIASLGITHELPMRIVTAQSPQQIQEELDSKGQKLKEAIDAYNKNKEAFDRPEAIYKIISAIAGMHSILKRFDNLATEATMVTVGAESQLIMVDGRPLEHIHMIILRGRF